MNVASLELCKELYELGFGDNTERGWFKIDGEYHAYPRKYFTVGKELIEFRAMALICPAYDLGYLLRKLPPTIYEHHPTKEYSRLVIEPNAINDSRWTFYYPAERNHFSETADTPEDAACKLGIE